MWDRILVAYNDIVAAAESSYLRKAQSELSRYNCLTKTEQDVEGFESTEEEKTSAIASLKVGAWAALRSKINEQMTDSTMLVKLKLAFEDRFRYDAEGVPRIWRPTDDIDAIFRKARDEVSDCRIALVFMLIRLFRLDTRSDTALREDQSNGSISTRAASRGGSGSATRTGSRL